MILEDNVQFTEEFPRLEGNTAEGNIAILAQVPAIMLSLTFR